MPKMGLTRVVMVLHRNQGIINHPRVLRLDMNNSRPMDLLLMALPPIHPKMDLLPPIVLLPRPPLQLIKARRLVSNQ